jgi:sulfite reductase (NADPH) hemoprotein beta-component
VNTPDDIDDLSGLEPAEAMKLHSNYLRGTILDSIADPVTGAMHGDDSMLIRYHGTYSRMTGTCARNGASRSWSPLISS